MTVIKNRPWYDNKFCSDICMVPLCQTLPLNELIILNLFYELYTEQNESDPNNPKTFTLTQLKKAQWNRCLEKYSSNQLKKIVTSIEEKTGFLIRRKEFILSSNFRSKNYTVNTPYIYFLNPAIVSMISNVAFIQPFCPIGMNPILFQILTYIFDEEPVTISDIVEKFNLNKSSIYNYLEDLETLGLILKSRNNMGMKKSISINHQHPLISRFEYTN